MQWNSSGGPDDDPPGAVSMRAIEDIWNRLFVEQLDTTLTQHVHALRAAACGRNHALLSFGPRIECDSLLQVAREHLATTPSIHAFSDEPPSLYFSLKPGDDYLFARSVPTVLPTWLSQEESAQLLLFALLGPQPAVLAVARRLAVLLDSKLTISATPAEV